MNQSKTGLNDLFYKWIEDVKKAYRFSEEYNDILNYYEGKLVGYYSLSFDRIFSSISTITTDEPIIYWIDKIDRLNKKKIAADIIMRSYYSLMDLLTPGQKKALRMMTDFDYFYESTDKIRNNSFKQFKSIVIRKWDENIK
jgi:Tfp pilus assembly pilus retraction ATPase PilT